jgi:hypothetical protein
MKTIEYHIRKNGMSTHLTYTLLHKAERMLITRKLKWPGYNWTLFKIETKETELEA